MHPFRPPPATISSGACTGYRRRVHLHKTAPDSASAQALQRLLSAVRALKVTVGVGAALVPPCVGNAAVPRWLGTSTTYGLPTPRVTLMARPALSSSTSVAPGKAAATVRADCCFELE